MNSAFTSKLALTVFASFAVAAVGASAFIAAHFKAKPMILFVGNSYTSGQGSSAQTWHAASITDLAGAGTGGIPAMVGLMAEQLGNPLRIYVLAPSGADLKTTLDRYPSKITSRKWNFVILQEYSTFNEYQPGNLHNTISAVTKISTAVTINSPDTKIILTENWPRADFVHFKSGPWKGDTHEYQQKLMGKDFQLILKSVPNISSLSPIGDAWVRAIGQGHADSDPFDGIDAKRFSLWADDGSHPSIHGAYLSALLHLSIVTGHDPRSLGEKDCVAFELGITPSQASKLQDVAHESLVAKFMLASKPVQLKPKATQIQATAKICKTPALEFGGLLGRLIF